MPLIRKFESTRPDEPEMKIWRYWCECLTPTHVLELVEHGEDLELGICVEPKGGLWCRIKTAWNILRGKDQRYTEVVIGKQEREELAAVIRGDVAT